MGGRFICNEQELLALPNHLVAFLVFHGRSGCTVYMQRRRIADASESPSHIPGFHGRSGCEVHMQRTRIVDPSEPRGHVLGFPWGVGL